MVPGAFVLLDELPLNANGKVDRRALPAPEWGAEAEYVAPRTEMEELLCEIWIEVLAAKGETRSGRVGIHDNFFDLGGHSLLATQVLTRIREVLGIQVPLRALFETPTVAELATVVEDRFLGGLDASEVAEELDRLETAGDPDPGRQEARAGNIHESRCA
jgi:acyl carrier protein